MMQASTVSPANRDDSHWEEAILSIWSSEGLVHSPQVFGLFFFSSLDHIFTDDHQHYHPQICTNYVQ